MLPFLFLLFALAKLTSSITYLCNSNAACGCSTNPALITKIIGGESASIDTWGWAASLYIDEAWMCGGSILSSSWILTAAHCVQNMQPSQVIVSAATNQLFGWKQWRFASSIIVHPQYNNETIENDIALINVSPPFNMTDPGIAKICLPISTTEDYPPIDSTVVAIGWGETTEDGNVSETLQQVTLQRISYEDYRCFYLISNESMQFCAGIDNDGKGPCFGDSGSPLMMFTSSRQWIVVGIVSYGYKCADGQFANVYTRIVYYLDWIRSMNVTDAMTIETITITSMMTTLAETSNSTNNSLSSHQHTSVLVFVASIILVLLIISDHNSLYFTI